MKLHVKVLLVLFIFISQVKAAGDSVSHVFSIGDVIKASEVNANFQELSDRIATATIANNAAQTFSLSNYAINPSITTLKYSISNDGMGSHDTEIKDLTRNGNEITILRKRLSGGESGTATQCHRLTYDNNTQGLNLTKREHFSADCSSLSITYTMANGIRVYDATMVKGLPFGGGFEAAVTTSSTSATHWGNDVSTVLGTEDVTLTVNGASTTYTNCLKIYRDRQFFSWGDSYKSTSWRCAEVGVVKKIESQSTSGVIHSRKSELYATS